MRLKFWLAALLLGLLVVLTGCGSSGPSDTVEDFYRSVEAGKPDQAISLLSSTLINNMGEDKLKQGLVQQTKVIKDKGGITSIRTEEEVIGDTAEVKAEVTYGDGETQSETVTLAKEDGNWKITPQSK